MSGQSSAAAAVELVREALRLAPTVPGHELTALEELDYLEQESTKAAEWAERLVAAVVHLSDEERISLIAQLAQLARSLALRIPEKERNLFLSMMAGGAEAD